MKMYPHSKNGNINVPDYSLFLTLYSLTLSFYISRVLKHFQYEIHLLYRETIVKDLSIKLNYLIISFSKIWC